MEFYNTQGQIVAMKTPDGKIKVVKNSFGPVGEVFESEQAIIGKYQHVNEGKVPSIQILESING